MESKLNKARNLIRELSGKQKLGVFTDRDGILYFEGRVIDPTERDTIANRFDRIITIIQKTITK